MWKKKLTLILIPNASGILKQLSIPVATVYLAAAAVVILLLGSFFLSLRERRWLGTATLPMGSDS